MEKVPERFRQLAGRALLLILTTLAGYEAGYLKGHDEGSDRARMLAREGAGYDDNGRWIVIPIERNGLSYTYKGEDLTASFSMGYGLAYHNRNGFIPLKFEEYRDGTNYLHPVRPGGYASLTYWNLRLGEENPELHIYWPNDQELPTGAFVPEE